MPAPPVPSDPVESPDIVPDAVPRPDDDALDLPEDELDLPRTDAAPLDLEMRDALPEDTALPRSATAPGAGLAEGALATPPLVRPGAPKLGLEQIVALALRNPLVAAAQAEVEAMEQQLRKATFAWVPIIDTEATLTPGLNVRCDEVYVTYAPGQEPIRDDGPGSASFPFQYCRTEEDPDYDPNTVRDYFEQIGEAGVRFEFSASLVQPITTFGKLRNLKRLAKVGVALQKLEKLQIEQETLLRVFQAYTTLLLARESLVILREADDIVDQALGRIESELGGGEDDWDAEPAETLNPERDPDDLFKTQLAELEIEELARQALKVEAVALAALRGLAGEGAPRGFDVAEATQPRFTVAGGLQDLESYQAMAQRERPTVRMARAAVQARELQARLARSQFLPDLGLVIRAGVARSSAADMEMSQLYYVDGFNYTRLSAALALRWRWDFHNKWFDLEAARATRRAAEYQVEAAKLLLAQEVEEAYRDLLEASHRIAIKERAVDVSRKLVVSAQQKDTVGGGDAGELVKYLETWYRKRFELAEAVATHNQALARLSRAVGTTLVEPRRNREGAAPGGPE